MKKKICTWIRDGDKTLIYSVLFMMAVWILMASGIIPFLFFTSVEQFQKLFESLF